MSLRFQHETTNEMKKPVETFLESNAVQGLPKVQSLQKVLSFWGVWVAINDGFASSEWSQETGSPTVQNCLFFVDLSS